MNFNNHSHRDGGEQNPLSTEGAADTDPFAPSELKKIRLGQNFGELAQTKQLLTSVSVRKPGKQEFIRVRPGDEHRFDTCCLTNEQSNEVYLVSPALMNLLKYDVRPTLLVVCLARSSTVPFLWPLTIPDADRPNRWHRTALECAKEAEKKWIRVVSDADGGQYSAFEAVRELSEPDWSDVPPMEEILKLAFKDKFLTSPDDALVKRLLGEA